MKNNTLYIPISITILFCLSACSNYRLPQSPIRMINYTDDINLQANTMVVLLPGLGDSPEDFLKNGFVASLQACNPNLMIIAVDTHLGYFNEHTLTHRLAHDVIIPAREKGIEKIWFVGVSLGGLGSLIYTLQYPKQVEAVILIAPYLGKINEMSELLATNDIANWQEQKGNEMHTLWKEFIRLTTMEQAPSFYLAYANEDRFSPLHKKLATLLDKDHVYTTQGGHNWVAWKTLWQQILKDIKICKI